MCEEKGKFLHDHRGRVTLLATFTQALKGSRWCCQSEYWSVLMKEFTRYGHRETVRECDLTVF